MARNDDEAAVKSAFDLAASGAGTARYVLRLYVTGLTRRSQVAIESTKRTCDEFLKDRYDLEVVDILAHPELAEGEQIVAVPTLIKRLPLPLRRLVGDLSDRERVLLGLDLQEVGKE